MFGIIKSFLCIFVNYNYKQYWAYRDRFYNSNINKIKKKWYSFYINQCNIKFCADIPLPLKEDIFKGQPQNNNHGLNGIVIAGGARIGNNCYISHQVTIGRSMNGVPTIGDNVYIGPGAKIFGDIKIGNNVRIGANCPVFFDVPDNATVVLPKPRIIIKDEGYEYYAYNAEKMKEKEGEIEQ